MAYNIKDVFYLDTSMTLAASAAGGTSNQIDLSAYVDPTSSSPVGLAVYKVHFSVNDSGNTNDPAAVDVDETGIFRAGLIAGLGTGDQTTGNIVFAANTINTSNDLMISGFDWCGPDAFGTGVYGMSPSLAPQKFIDPSTEVPYVVVRDNVCLVAETAANLATAKTVTMRMECAKIKLTQATLNQLLRTQTV
jgi:hypothetical protein